MTRARFACGFSATSFALAAILLAWAGFPRSAYVCAIFAAFAAAVFVSTWGD